MSNSEHVLDLEPAMTAASLSFSFRTKKGLHPVLREISFSVPKAKITSIFGPSGCGKSTLLRLITGLLGADQGHTFGKLSVFGSSPPEARKAGLVAVAFQNPVLLPWRTVLENVQLPWELRRNRFGQFDNSDELLRLMKLEGYNDWYPAQLSVGMQQRVNLARAMACQPKLLLLDEPFRALDEVTREQMAGEVLEVRDKFDTTVIHVTHTLADAIYSDIVLVMSRRPSHVVKVIHLNRASVMNRDRLMAEIREALDGQQ